MSVSHTRAGKAFWWVAIAIVVMALNLRPILAATGPLLDIIQQATALSDAQAGLMTTLPIFVMGLCALAAGPLQRWPGTRWGIAVGGLVIALACALRQVWPTASTLLITAVLSGMGIALVQALMPAFIKGRFGDRAGTLMGLYSTGIMGGAAFAAALSPSVAEQWGWAPAQAMWAVPALLAVGLWLACCGPGPAAAAAQPADDGDSAVVTVWRSPRAWLLMLFFGIGTGAYTLVLAWLAPYYLQLGWSARASGGLLAMISIGEVLAGLLVSLLVHRFVDRRVLLLSVLGLVALALAGLLVAPQALVVPITVCLSLGIGALFPLTLIVTLDHARSAAHAGALLGFVQGGGYMLSSVMPLIAGALRSQGHSLSVAWGIMLVCCVVLAAMAWRFRPLPR